MISSSFLDYAETEVPERTAQLVVGGESFLGPVFSLSSSDTEETAEARGSGSPIRMLDDVVASSMKRAKNFNTATAWIDAGLACLADKQLDEAEAAFERAKALDPLSWRRTQLGLARVAKERGDNSKAIALLSELSAMNPDDVEVRVGLALALFGDQQVHQSLEVLKDDPAHIKRFANFFAARGAIHLSTNALASSIRDLRLVVRLRPDWVYARNALGLAEARNGNDRGAEQRFREAVRISPFYEESLLNLTQVLGRAGRWDDVVETIERYWTPESASGPVAFAAGYAAIEAGTFRAARHWMQAALAKADVASDRGLALNNLGVIADRLGDDDGAADLFERAVKAKPTEISVANFGRALLTSGKIELAIDFLRRHLHTAADGVAVRQALSAGLYYMGRYDEAAALGESLMQSASEQQLANSGVYALMVSVYADGTGNVEAAIATARAGLRVLPHDPILLNNLAYALIRAGDTDTASKTLDRLGALVLSNDQRVYATATRGLLALERGDLNTGRQLYEEAARICPRPSLREKVKVKRDLEMARAIIRLGGSLKEAAGLLVRAANVGLNARPYSLQAETELRRLRG